MKRIFIAVKVEPGPELLKATASLKALLAGESIKWADLTNTHLTLAFLGDTEEKKLKILTGMLSEKCSGFGKFSFILAGMGIFRNFRDPRVIWTGIKGSEDLMTLCEAISSGLKEYGFPVEERQFKPHLTLGRIRSIQNTVKFRNAIELYTETEFQSVEVSSVFLFESILMQTGPVYKVIGKYTLT